MGPFDSGGVLWALCCIWYFIGIRRGPDSGPILGAHRTTLGVYKTTGPLVSEGAGNFRPSEGGSGSSCLDFQLLPKVVVVSCTV